MHYLAKAGIATLGIGALAGGGTAGYLHMTRKTLTDQLGVSVLELTGNKDQTAWEKRKSSLRSITDNSLVPSLKKLASETWEELQKWCKAHSTKSYDANSAEFKNFERFCTWKIGDKTWEKKIDNSVQVSDQKWGQAHSALQGINDLPKSLITVRDTKATGNNNADKQQFVNDVLMPIKKLEKEIMIVLLLTFPNIAKVHSL